MIWPAPDEVLVPDHWKGASALIAPTLFRPRAPGRARDLLAATVGSRQRRRDHTACDRPARLRTAACAHAQSKFTSPSPLAAAQTLASSRGSCTVGGPEAKLHRATGHNSPSSACPWVHTSRVANNYATSPELWVKRLRAQIEPISVLDVRRAKAALSSG